MQTKKNIYLKYDELEKKFRPSGANFATYDTPVNFKESLTQPIHRWYGYKEGFSPSFVESFIRKYAKDKQDVVLDPFGGVGTTALVAMQMGHTAYSMDVNPLSVFVARTKTRKYKNSDIKQIQNSIENLKRTTKISKDINILNTTVEKYFDATTFDAILRILTFIKKINNTVVRDIFRLAIVSLIPDLSTHKKNGNGVKKKKKVPQPHDFKTLKEIIIKRINLFCEDITSQKNSGECIIWEGSNLKEYTLPQKASLVLTSPPYANCFDYSKVYLTELWMGGFFKSPDDQKKFRIESVSSHVHFSWPDRNEKYGSSIVNDLIIPYLSTADLWSEKIPKMLIGYFCDIGKFLSNLSKNLKDKAIVGIVVGNSVYGGLPIATDILIAEMAEKIGYECTEIKIYRKVVASSQQMILLNKNELHFVRESMVVLRWSQT